MVTREKFITAAEFFENERAINVLPEGTPDPDLLAYAHTNAFVLLTHDEAIRKHVTKRQNDGVNHAGVFIALSHLQGQQGIGTIVRYLVEFDQLIKGGAATVREDVYNQVLYIS